MPFIVLYVQVKQEFVSAIDDFFCRKMSVFWRKMDMTCSLKKITEWQNLLPMLRVSLLKVYFRWQFLSSRWGVAKFL